MAETERAQEGAPNVLVIVLDDMGFGHLGCYGSPIADAATSTRLAATGCATATCTRPRSARRRARASSRAATTIPTTWRASRTARPAIPGRTDTSRSRTDSSRRSCCSRATTPTASESGTWPPRRRCPAAGPYDRWPLGRGFERYYGFLGGDTHQYYPELVRDNSQTEPERTPEEGYHLTEDLVEKAKAMIADSKQVAPDKPFFLYFAPGAMHSPHHVAQEWADRIAGQFDARMGALSKAGVRPAKEARRDPGRARCSRATTPTCPTGRRCRADERSLYARMMEVFAGFLTHTDHYIGELIAVPEGHRRVRQHPHHADLGQRVQRRGRADTARSTSAGSSTTFRHRRGEPASHRRDRRPEDFNHFAWGWTYAGNTPFRRWKRETYRGGGERSVHRRWPKGIKAGGEVRTQYAHIIDMVPTVLDALGLEPPATIRGVTQSPIEGVSFAQPSTTPRADPALTQYFEMMGHRSIYHDGCRAVCPWPGPSFQSRRASSATPITEDMLTELDARAGSSTTSSEDFAETKNLAERKVAPHRDDRDVVRGGRKVQRAANRQPRYATHR